MIINCIDKLSDFSMYLQTRLIWRRASEHYQKNRGGTL